MPKIKIVALIFAAFVFAVSAAAAQEGHTAENDDREKPVTIKPNDPLPNVTARSAVVMEAKTGLIVYARDMDLKSYPASTTKMMTLITALDKGNLSDTVRVGGNAAFAEGSTLWLEEGDKVPLRELLTGMMMVSGNDGAVAVAEHVGGSIKNFARMMNEKAREIGAEHTHFVNPSGLPDENHYTTAHDLALMAAYGLKNDKFTRITSTKEQTFPWVKDPSHLLRNENQLLWIYPGANGIKTGYTDAAGRCLVSSAERGGTEIVAVVLDSLYMWNDSIALLDYGFKNLHSFVYVNRGETCGNIAVQFGRKKKIPIKTAKEIILPAAGGSWHREHKEYRREVDLPPMVAAPVKRGDKIGELRVFLGDKEIDATSIIAADDVEEKSFFRMVINGFKKLLA